MTIHESEPPLSQPQHSWISSKKIRGTRGNPRLIPPFTARTSPTGYWLLQLYMLGANIVRGEQRHERRRRRGLLDIRPSACLLPLTRHNTPVISNQFARRFDRLNG